MPLGGMSVAGQSAAGGGLEELRRELKRSAPQPVYVVEGEEALLASDAVQCIVDAALPAAGRDFNLNHFSGDDEAGRDFLALARTYPFLAERRVVVLRRFDKLKFGQPRDEAAFLEYLRQPSEQTVLVLVASRLDRRTSVARELEKSARLVSAAPLSGSALPSWVRQRFAARGFQVSESTCRRLIDLTGPSLLDLGNEIDKVVARYAGTKSVGEAEIDATVGQHRAEEVWAINRAFRPDDPAGFLQAMARVLESDDELVRLAAVLARHVNDLLRVRLLLDRGVTSPYQVAGKLRKPPWMVEQQLAQARPFSRAQLVLWLRNLQRADVQMKSVKLPQRWVLERALLNSFMGQELV
jgi:DNA polymerase-3 subunit delta